MPKIKARELAKLIEEYTPVFQIDSLEELAKIFEGFARISAGKYARNPELRRGAVLAFTHAASITRRTIMGKQDAKS